MTRLTIWLPPLVWMAAILWFSSGDFSAEQTASFVRPILAWLLPWASEAQIHALHGLVRKTAHVTVYALLVVLWFVALVRARRWSPGRAASVALLIAVAWAALDELHQATEPSRTGSVLDVGFDAAGGLVAALVCARGWRRSVGVATTVLLWVGAAGGAALIAVNLASGAGSGVLWITVPAASLLLLRRRRKASARAAARRL